MVRAHIEMGGIKKSEEQIYQEITRMNTGVTVYKGRWWLCPLCASRETHPSFTDIDCLECTTCGTTWNMLKSGSYTACVTKVALLVHGDTHEAN